MPQITLLQENFNAGEFGPRMDARVQFDKYRNAGSIVQNSLPMPQGGWTRRPASRYIADAKSNSVRPWLVDFVFSTIQAYVLELGETIARFFKDQAQIVAEATDAVVTNGTFDSNITDWDDKSGGAGSITHDATNSRLQLTPGGATSSDIGVAEQDITTTDTGTEHVIKFEVQGDPGDKIQFQVGTATTLADTLTAVELEVGFHTVSFTPTTSPFFVQFRNRGETANKDVFIDNVSLLDDEPVEIDTPWSESELPDLSMAQSKDTVFFALGGSTRVYRLERRGHSDWSLIKTLFEDGPFLDQNDTPTTLLLSATSGLGINVTASSIFGINDGLGFRATDVGRLIRWEDAANNWTWLQITAITSTLIVVADILGPDASATTATADWRLGEWNDTDGWPSVVGFIQNRLGLAATTFAPQKFWLSNSVDIFDFADTDVSGAVQNDSSINYRFGSLKVQTIQWMAMRKRPVVGTNGGEWTLVSGGEVLTPSDIAAVQETSMGSAKIQPVEARNRLLYVQNARRKLLEFADIVSETGIAGFDSFDQTILHDRIFTSGVIQNAYAQEPDSVIWNVRNDGQLATLTYQPDQQVVGWARQIMGGNFQSIAPVVESVTTIPGTDGAGQYQDSTGRHEVWVAVKRTINGVVERYIEVFEKMFDGDEDEQHEAFYVDSGLTLDGETGVFVITDITNTDPAVVTTLTAHGFADGAEVRTTGVKGFLEDTGELDSEDNAILQSGVNDLTFLVANKTATTFEVTDIDGLDLDASAFTAYAADGEVRKKTASISGLGHLEGEVVKVFGDGAWQTDKTVVAGAITADFTASVFHVGLGYEHKWRSLKLAYGATQGTSVGVSKILEEATLVLLETAEGSIKVASEGKDGVGEFTELDLSEILNDQAVPLATGEVELGVTGDFNRDTRIILKGSTGPCTVLGIGPEIQTNEQG